MPPPVTGTSGTISSVILPGDSQGLTKLSLIVSKEAQRNPLLAMTGEMELLVGKKSFIYGIY